MLRYPGIALGVLLTAVALTLGVQLTVAGNIYGPVLLWAALVVMHVVTHAPEPAAARPRTHWDALLHELEQRRANGEVVLYAPLGHTRQR